MIRVHEDASEILRLAERLAEQARLADARRYALDYYGPRAAKVVAEVEEDGDAGWGYYRFSSVEVYDAQGNRLEPDPDASGWAELARVPGSDLLDAVARWMDQWITRRTQEEQAAAAEPLPEGWGAFQPADWIRLWVERHPQEAYDLIEDDRLHFFARRGATYDLTAPDDPPRFALVEWEAGDAQPGATVEIALSH